MSKWIQQEENTLCENLTQTLNDTHDDTWLNKDIKSWLYILKNEHERETTDTFTIEISTQMWPLKAGVVINLKLQETI